MAKGQYKNIGRIEPGAPNQSVAGIEDENGNVLEVTVRKGIPGTTPAVSKVSVSTVTIALTALDDKRVVVILKNNGPNTCFISNAAATLNDMPLYVGESFTDTWTTEAWNAICDTAESADVRVWTVDKAT